MGSPHGWTRQPCHGCGSTEMHRKDALCSDCRALFDHAKRVDEHQQEEVRDGSVVVMHSDVRHMISRPYLLDNSARWGSGRMNDELGDAWACLLRLLLVPSELDDHDEYLITDKPDTWGAKNEGYMHRGDIWVIKANLRDALNRFDMAIRLALQYCYLSGKAQGLELLSRLNDGTVALSAYEAEGEKVEMALQRVEKMNRQTAKYKGPFDRGDESIEDGDEEDEEDEES